MYSQHYFTLDTIHTYTKMKSLNYGFVHTNIILPICIVNYKYSKKLHMTIIIRIHVHTILYNTQLVPYNID